MAAFYFNICVLNTSPTTVFCKGRRFDEGQNCLGDACAFGDIDIYVRVLIFVQN